jgi:hypothetical protein
VFWHLGKERDMGTFKHLQRKSSIVSTPGTQTSQRLRSSRLFAPEQVPIPEHVSPHQQTQPTHSTPLKYALADIPLFHPERENRAGLPSNLKIGIENLSGMAMDDVHVHYNSSKPTRMRALAYTRGTEIHVGPGQEKHLPHEAWHVAQQKQGRVKPTLQAMGGAINDDTQLEREADVMGERANKVSHLRIQRKELINSELVGAHAFTGGLIQFRRETYFDATNYDAGLNPVFDPTVTHFTYLEDGEITGTAAQPWLAQPGENLHVTIQNKEHTIVAHYFYNKATNTWRFHSYGGAPAPYGVPPAANLQILQNRAIEYAWPPGAVKFKVGKKLSQKERRNLSIN